MTPEQGYDHLKSLIESGKPHRYHDKTVERAKTCKTLLGDSEAQRDILHDFTIREDESQQEARIRLTNSITRASLEPVLSYFQEVRRADGIRGVVEADGASKGKIENHFSNFYAGWPLIDYCFDRALYASELDPNSWTVFEALFQVGPNGANSITDIYPVEITSEQVLSYDHDQTGTLQYVAFNLPRMVEMKTGGAVKLNDFYLYGIGFSVHFAEVRPEANDPRPYADYDTIDTSKGSYMVRLFSNGTKEVPAVRWSAYLDKLCENKIGEALYEAAIPIIRDLIRDKSFFDVQKVLHIRPEKIQYVKPCNHMDEVSGEYCEGGYYGGMRNKDHICGACGGTGKLTTSGEQDAITLAWPDRPEEIADLARITHYVDRPTEILKIYREEINLASTLIFLTTFNQQGVDVESITSVKTATQSKIEYDKINNKLYPFAKLIETAWELAHRVAFQYYGQTPKTVNLTFPLDFKLKDLSALIQDREAAKNAGLPYDIISGIDNDILKKQYRNAPQMVMEAQSFERWKPWRSKDPAEVVMILGERDRMDPARLLYENWDLVIETVKQERADARQEPFYVLAPMEQRKILYETAERLAQDIVFSENTGGMDAALMEPFNPPQDEL